MRNTLDEQIRNMDTLCRFNHRFVFWVCNLHEIVSVQVINSRLDYYQPVDKNGYFWGQYEVHVSYRRPDDGGETRQKKFTHGFIINFSHSQPGISQEKQWKYACKATCSYQVAPFLPMLFPFLSRINYVPFKVVLDVAGRIGESMDERINCGEECGCLESREDCHCLGKEAREEAWENKEKEVAVPIADVDVGDKIEEEVVDLDLIVLEKKGMPREQDTKSTHLRGYDLYYNMLMEHQESIQPPQLKNEATDGKAVIKKRSKKTQG